MALNKTIRKPKKVRTDEPDSNLIDHIRALGLANVEEYRAWCARHGFSRQTDKNRRQRLQEREVAFRAASEARLAERKQAAKRPERIVERVLSGEVSECELPQTWLEIRRAVKSAQESAQTKSAIRELLRHICTCSDLLDGRNVIGPDGYPIGRTFIDGLVALARHSRNWLRPVADWQPRTHNSRRQFSSLARHLFANWPIPAFMDSVWFLGNGQEAVRRQNWFVHLGSGRNIRTADLPLAYTKRMAHFFMQAPADLSVDAALRFGQVRALGGSERLVRAVVATPLGASFEHDEFWLSVIQFFIANPMLDLAHVGPIVDYIRDQRFGAHPVFVAPGVVNYRQPAKPNFTMKGRTPASMLRQVEQWHADLAKSVHADAEWKPSGIAGFDFVEGNEQTRNLRIWTIRELLGTKALAAEGHQMKHCVASYGYSCASGRCSIWTVEMESFEGRIKLLTIEVLNSTREICQVRGKCNRLPTERELAVVRRWAAQSRLSLKHNLY